jgi:hypothetical protein
MDRISGAQFDTYARALCTAVYLCMFSIKRIPTHDGIVDRGVQSSVLGHVLVLVVLLNLCNFCRNRYNLKSNSCLAHVINFNG